MVTVRKDALAIEDIRALVAPELRAARDTPDLKARLARLGFGLKPRGARAMLVTLPHGIEVVDLPAPAFFYRAADDRA